MTWPVVAEVGGAVLHLLAGRERRHGPGDAVERALRGLRRRRIGAFGRIGALLRLDAFPLAVHVRRRPRLGLAEDVRVSADDLRGDRGLDVGEVEHPRLGGELGMEHDLEQEVAEFARQFRRRPGLQRVVHLVRLFEQVIAQATRGSARDPTDSRPALEGDR